ncbi:MULTISPECIES: aminoglycoside phosphotransferase family protein [unclassified Paenibacillus]|uniref:aminoglycoside phosphotransferase family protein n=1 Tax=unclassified Paenibacillus TaxID=185978 RepID=UPI0009A7F745|nr:MULTISPECIES: aminoglycoside phosphotransferase family protein [unclassified Paenibacillus]SLK20360.1 Phosphotransferase enzyme family protein [Paenibacillus sp. RU5A]SOC76152.1 Phosphotransferase enzyme family protein [Paenibacillus sp. RU26A]SOC77809.1 Phosphotransferase enzyme family protein [Paenibacillus sp. RU5M]
MSITLENIRWVELNEEIRCLLEKPYKMLPLSPGLEANVVKIECTDHNYVLKIWNKDSKPNIRNQYELLSELYESGIQVSQPYGWGMDVDSNQVLLTSYDGEPIAKLSKTKLEQLAQKLIQVHGYDVKDTGNAAANYIPQYDFVGYFFPSIELHEDMHQILTTLLQRTELRQDHLIHGDYNLGNVLEAGDQYAIIDWTNGQRGDPRYDMAWSIFLMTVYAGERNGKMYSALFKSLTEYTPDDAEIFEAMACLRWILLKRVSNVPMGPGVMQRIKKIIGNNSYLNDELL